MATVSSGQVRGGLSKLIDRVRQRRERLKVTRRGEPVVAIVPVEDLELLEEVLDFLQDARDLPAVRKRLRQFQETGEAVPWEQIKASQGL
jgi:prevent-host-death family protein